MIGSPYLFVFILVSVIVGIKTTERRSCSKIFEFVPSLLIHFAIVQIDEYEQIRENGQRLKGNK